MVEIATTVLISLPSATKKLYFFNFLNTLKKNFLYIFQ
jgi:hypothetical protein